MKPVPWRATAPPQLGQPVLEYRGPSEQRGDPAVALWGIRLRAALLHIGRALLLTAAVLAAMYAYALAVAAMGS